MTFLSPGTATKTDINAILFTRNNNKNDTNDIPVTRNNNKTDTNDIPVTRNNNKSRFQGQYYSMTMNN